MNKKQFDNLFYSDPQPSQHPFELFNLLKFLENYELKTIIEIGVFKGGTFKFWREIIEKGGTLIGIDSGERGYIQGLIDSKKENEHFVIGDSTSNETCGKVCNLTPYLADMLFIDGNHEYRYVKSDFAMYSELVDRDGLIIFHDIVNPAVLKVWNEIKENYQYQGMIEFYGKDRPCGIGVIVK
jgi:cephalosporin hydroxylase